MRKSEDLAKKIMEEEEKKRRKEFKSKLSERVQSKTLPKLARLKDNHALECVLCRFSCKEEISFTKHYVLPAHKKVLINKIFYWRERCFLVNKKEYKYFCGEKALEEFQRNYAKKKEAINEKKEEKIDVQIGVKRPANVEYRVEETYEIVENEEEKQEAEALKSEYLRKKQEFFEEFSVPNDLHEAPFENVKIPDLKSGLNQEETEEAEINKKLTSLINDEDEETIKRSILKKLMQKREQKKGEIIPEEPLEKEPTKNNEIEETCPQKLFDWKRKRLF